MDNGRETAGVGFDIGVFAYNEESQIGDLIADLARQTALNDSAYGVRVQILANGCRDKTVTVAQQAIAGLAPDVAARFVVHDFAEGGKSRTANRFLHELSAAQAGLLGFMDADIGLPQTDTLARMFDQMAARPALKVFNSRPIKDVSHYDLDVGAVAKLIAAGGDGLSNYRKSICGQLYVMRREMADMISLPIGLPVEDGFIRAMVLTDLLTQPEDLDRMDGEPEIFHVYESIRTLGDLLHHQTRLVVGSALNAALYRHMRQDTPDLATAKAMLVAARQDEGWLPRVIAQELPRWPYGYIPFRIGAKRIATFRQSHRRGPKAIAVLCAGVALDAIVYVRATWVMMRGKSTGFW